MVISFFNSNSVPFITTTAGEVVIDTDKIDAAYASYKEEVQQNFEDNQSIVSGTVTKPSKSVLKDLKEEYETVLYSFN